MEFSIYLFSKCPLSRLKVKLFVKKVFRRDGGHVEFVNADGFIGAQTEG